MVHEQLDMTSNGHQCRGKQTTRSTKETGINVVEDMRVEGLEREDAYNEEQWRRLTIGQQV